MIEVSLTREYINAWASLSVEAKLCQSKGEFHRLVAQGGVYLIVESPTSILLRIGKKKFHRFKLLNKPNITKGSIEYSEKWAGKGLIQ